MIWSNGLLLAQAGATLAMTGLIWFVQVVHYPLLGRVGPAGYTAYQREHQRRTTLVVAPIMLLEAATAALLLWQCPGGIHSALPWLGVALLLIIWLSTAFLQVPAHRRLESGFDAAAHRRLVVTNWLRTTAWTARGGLVLVMMILAWIHG
jgi:hypothetical protein